MICKNCGQKHRKIGVNACAVAMHADAMYEAIENFILAYAMVDNKPEWATELMKPMRETAGKYNEAYREPGTC